MTKQIGNFERRFRYRRVVGHKLPYTTELPAAVSTISLVNLLTHFLLARNTTYLFNILTLSTRAALSK